VGLEQKVVEDDMNLEAKEREEEELKVNVDSPPRFMVFRGQRRQRCGLKVRTHRSKLHSYTKILNHLFSRLFCYRPLTLRVES